MSGGEILGSLRKLKRSNAAKTGELRERGKARRYIRLASNEAGRIAKSQHRKISSRLTDHFVVSACMTLIKKFCLSAKTCCKFMAGFQGVAESVTKGYVTHKTLNEIIATPFPEGIGYKHKHLKLNRAEALKWRLEDKKEDYVVAAANVLASETACDDWYILETMAIIQLHDKHNFGKSRIEKFIREIREHAYEFNEDNTENLKWLQEHGLELHCTESFHANIDHGKVTVIA